MNDPKDNSGAIFVNDRKSHEAQPDRKGTAMINGVEYWVSGWLKKNDRGPWLSLSFTPKDKPAAPAPAPRQQDRKGPPSKSSTSWADEDEAPF